MLSIDPDAEPVVGVLRPKTNSHGDFNSFVRWCVTSNMLKEGDYLIVDNSRIHTSTEGFAELVQYLEKLGIALKLLPKYSPELNPIELIFAFVKHILRNYYDSSKSLQHQVMSAFRMVSRMLVFQCYLHCLNPLNQLY